METQCTAKLLVGMVWCRICWLGIFDAAVNVRVAAANVGLVSVGSARRVNSESLVELSRLRGCVSNRSCQTSRRKAAEVELAGCRGRMGAQPRQQGRRIVATSTVKRNCRVLVFPASWRAMAVGSNVHTRVGRRQRDSHDNYTQALQDFVFAAAASCGADLSSGERSVSHQRRVTHHSLGTLNRWV